MLALTCIYCVAEVNTETKAGTNALPVAVQYGEDTSTVERVIIGGQGNRTQRNPSGSDPKSGKRHSVVEVAVGKEGCNVEASAGGLERAKAYRRSPSPSIYHRELVYPTHSIHCLPYIT